MKRKEKILVVFLFLIALLIPAQAYCGGGSPEQAEIQRQIDGLKIQINALEERLKASEVKQKSAEERLKVAEKIQRKPLAEMMTALGDKIEIGGELEFEYVDTQGDSPTISTTQISSPGNARGHFQMDKIRLKVKVMPDENKEFKFKLDFQDIEEKVSVDEAYFTFKNIAPFEQKISLGLKDRFIGGDFIEYYTEGSPLARTAFWRDPDLGIQYSGKKSPFYWHLSLTNGMQLQGKDIGEDSTEGFATAQKYGGRDDLLQDDDENEDFGSNKQVGIGLGYNPILGRLGNLNILGFGYFSKLASPDIPTYLASTNYLADTTLNPRSDRTDRDKTQRRYGLNLAYTKDALETCAQYIRAQDSYLRRHVWMLQTSYKFDLGWRYLKAIQPLFRWDYYMVRLPHNPIRPLTWDRRRYTTALLNHIKENLILKLEYAHNLEDTGGYSPRNDEFLAQLEYKF